MFGFNEEMSQGERQYFDELAFEKAHRAKKPPNTRITTQRITGVDEKRRLVCAMSQNASYFADSVNSLVPKKGIHPLVLLGIVNSSVLNWRFDLTSTNNNVGTNELDVLPFPKTIDAKSTKELAQVVERLMKMQSNKSHDILASDAYAELNAIIYRMFLIGENEQSVIEGRWE